jgi:hypothetical protein
MRNEWLFVNEIVNFYCRSLSDLAEPEILDVTKHEVRRYRFQGTRAGNRRRYGSGSVLQRLFSQKKRFPFERGWKRFVFLQQQMQGRLYRIAF